MRQGVVEMADAKSVPAWLAPIRAETPVKVVTFPLQLRNLIASAQALLERVQRQKDATVTVQDVELLQLRIKSIQHTIKNNVIEQSPVRAPDQGLAPP
jgi:hypothetical protein